MARLPLTHFTILCLAISTASAVAQTPPLSFTPLNDLGSGLYLDQFQGGLYPNGSNEVPTAHASEGMARATAIQPLDTSGEPDSAGKYALVSIGMSNTTQEFCSGSQSSGCQSWSFMGQAAAHPAVEHESLVIVDGAQGGEPAQAWVSPTAETFDRVAERLAAANVTESQVAAVWLKQADPRPTGSLPSVDADAFTLLQHLGDIVRASKIRYPNLQVVFLSSRTYAGYATSNLNPEPYAYESGIAVKWLIEAQIDQMDSGGIDPQAGDLDYASGVAPWLAWGPYLWADGLNPRSDGLTWEVSDFSVNDGTHPSIAGREKVATLLMDFMLNSTFTQPWFLATLPGDFDGDGDVDGRDFLFWQRGGSPSPLSGADLVDWETNYGLGPLAASATVPEPASWVLFLALGMGANIGVRRRR